MTGWSVDTLPPIPGYVTVGQAARTCGVSKATVFYWIFESKQLTHAYRLGDSRATVAILEADVQALQARRLANEWKMSAPTLAQLQRGWRARVVEWAKSVDWNRRPINSTGQLPKMLVDDYLRVHPDDRRPQ